MKTGKKYRTYLKQSGKTLLSVKNRQNKSTRINRAQILAGDNWPGESRTKENGRELDKRRRKNVKTSVSHAARKPECLVSSASTV